MTGPRRVLVVDDERELRIALGQTLELADLAPVLAGSVIEAKDHISTGFEGVILSDVRMPGRDGFALLAHARATDPDLPVILLTGQGDIPMAVEGMRAGAFAFLEKPCAPGDLLAVIERALAARGLVLENRRLRARIEAGDAAARVIVGESQQAQTLRARVRAVAATRAPVLIAGEPGTGTAQVAEVIHALGGAAAWHRVNAAQAGPAELGEVLAAAGNGTVFVEEIGQLSGAAQLGLLDLIDAFPAARLIASATDDIDAGVQAGRFSPDLFYRLDVMRVHLPPLRDRREDIPAMFARFVALACEQAARPRPDIPADLVARLVAQPWPGNARALQNAAMRFALGLPDAGEEGVGEGLGERMRRVERALIVEALERHRGQAGAAAAALRLPRKTFYDKLARHGLRPEDYRGG